MKPPQLSVWPPLPLGVHFGRSADVLPFPFGEPGCLVFARARHALTFGLGALGLGAGDALLVPAYNHGSEVEAITRAGLACRFYEGTPRLEPDEAELEALVTPGVRALYLIHYLGFPQDAARWRRWCDERGLYLIEDAAQAWCARVDGRPVGSSGDLAIFCLYKAYGFPDGAALHLGRVAPATPTFHPVPTGAATLVRRHVAWLMGRSRLASAFVTRLQRRAPYDQEADFALGDARTPMSAATSHLLARVVEPDVDGRRRAHYRRILEAVRELVPPPFDEVPAGAVPFGLPIEVGDRDAANATLRKHGIAATIFWCGSHPAIPSDRFPGVAARRARTLLLPVHQELRDADVERIRAVAQELAREPHAPGGRGGTSRPPSGITDLPAASLS